MGNFTGYFENPHSYLKTAVATFGQFWATFYFKIWSHCLGFQRRCNQGNGKCNWNRVKQNQMRLNWKTEDTLNPINLKYLCFRHCDWPLNILV